MRQYKANLSVISDRYSDLERRVIEHFVDHPGQYTIFLPGGLQLLLGYLVKDGLINIKDKLLPTMGGAIFTNDEYYLTDSGKEFIRHLRGNEPLSDLIVWAEDFFPEGRHIYYEGNEPEVFAVNVKDEFGLDVTLDPGWAQVIDDDEGGSFRSYRFHCPVELLGKIYYGSRWPMGS
jgi:hypothetical protein